MLEAQPFICTPPFLSQCHFIVVTQVLEGIPADRQVLCYNGKHMDPYRDLSQYGVTPGSCIHLTCRLRGGKPVKVHSPSPADALSA